ncbi:hypothetical protein IDH44_16850 [Paenibacillus sp. IB182496]|uniref:Uncharacterized protein n=1 Tax=Paenibacillus sabuli TaxID=2772509 RepID=A0A927BU54_9BACL|nr:hypothetical protein [Paenibacillus sabuli]MBD2846868.1 hypothetical protein [Paenibacillus sabuli]
MKKTKLPGENISLKTKKTEHPAVMEWINAQSNLMDSLRYLIENELRQNGVRNLQAHVPAERALLPEAVQAAGAESAMLHSIGQLESAAASEASRDELEPPVEEDEIDDEDIESWT